MTRFIFVRHGETNENKNKRIQGRRDIPLNENGISQALMCAKYLKENNFEIQKIYSSPLQRAYKTASIIKDYLELDLDIVKEFNFIERSFGEMEGAPVIDKSFEIIKGGNVFGLEQVDEIQQRVTSKMFELSKIYKDKTILVVAHSHTIKAITTYLDPIKYDFSDKLSNCSLSIFDVEDNIKLIGFNIITN